MNQLGSPWYNWIMKSSYPTGYLAAARTFLDGAAKNDPAPIARPRPARPVRSPQLQAVTSGHRIAAAATLFAVVTLTPVACFIASIWS